MTPNQVVSRNMRRLRQARGWKQADLAARLGVSRSVVAQAEIAATDDGRDFSVNELVALTAVFGIELHEMLADVDLCMNCGNRPPSEFTCNTYGAAS
jgi:transcriptional regulator with XRE-family HTH domain